MPFSLLTISLGLLASTAAFAAGNVGSGFNTGYISRYLISRHGQCEACAANSYAMDKAEITQAMDVVAGTSLKTFRELLDLKRVFPQKGLVANVDDIAEILALYQERNATLLITFGQPFPDWMLRGRASGWCPIPEAAADWAQVKDDLSQQIGKLFEELWKHPKLEKSWMKNNLIVEPMNEFQDLGTPVGNECKPRHAATGARGADLSGGIAFVFAEKNVPFTVVGPSNNADTNFWREYYAAGGVGLPNVHLYPAYDEGLSPDDPAAVDKFVDKVVGELTALNEVVPANYKNSFIVGEVGLAEIAGQCEAGSRKGGAVRGEALKQYLTKLLGDARILQLTTFRLAWMGTDIKKWSYNTAGLFSAGSPHCEATMGLLRTDLTPKASLAEYLRSTDGIVLAQSQARTGKLRDEAKAKVKAILGRDATEAEVETLADLRIYGAPDVSFDEIVKSWAKTEDNKNKIAAEYQNTLQREPDAAGLRYWLDNLEQGQTIQQVSHNISISNEAAIRGFYRRYLGRGPDDAGMKYWLDSLKTGQTIEQVETSIRASEEAKRRSPASQAVP